MKRIIHTIATACLGAAIALGTFYLVTPETPSQPEAHLQNHTKPVAQSLPAESPPLRQVNLPMVLPDAGYDFTMAVESSLNSVVHITSQVHQSTQSIDPFRDFFYGKPNGTARSTGSGVIISNDGYIVTNNHVIDGADKISVTLFNKKTYSATVVGTDPSTDLALIHIEEKGLPNVNFGNSDQVKVGEWVLAMGNPFNLNNTVTAGIISAKGRSINLLHSDPNNAVFPLESFIQTDAAVNPGNSGGALVNTKGNLVGINTAIASQTGSYAGYSFAIPVNIVRKVTNDLLEFGKVQRAFIGVSIRDIDQQLADAKGLENLEGVFVADLTPGGAAFEAGIKRGDVITHVGAVKVDNVPELQEQIGRFRPGNKVAVTLYRDDTHIVKNVVLRNHEGNTTLAAATKASKIITALGANFSDVNESDRQALKIDGGVQISKITGGKLRGSGIREGFIITRIDKEKVTSSEQLIRLLENKKGGVLIEGVYPNGTKAYYGFGI